MEEPETLNIQHRTLNIEAGCVFLILILLLISPQRERAGVRGFIHVICG
jgi:hypothetical protein